MAITMEELYSELSGYWAQRKNTILQRWDYYGGLYQKYYLPRFSGETDDEYNSRIDGAVIENHCQKTADVLVGYLYGQPNAKSRVTVRFVDKKGDLVQDINQFFKYNIWPNNAMDMFRIGIALMASVTGVAVVHIEFIDSRTKLPFPKRTKKEDKIKYGSIRYDLYDSSETMPLPMIANNEVYPNILGGIVRCYVRDNFSGNIFLDRMLGRRFQQEEVLEFFDNEQFYRAKIEGGILVDPKTTPNPYGNISTVFTVFRNYGDLMFLEGQSDIEGMIPLQTALNGLATDDKSVIDYHTFPILGLFGGAKLPPGFIRKVNSVLEFDKDQKGEYLTWDNVLTASKDMKEEIRLNMTTTSGVSQMSRGNAANIGQVRSGAGLKTLFQADINTVGLKIPFFKEAERQLALATLRMWEAETEQKFEEAYCEVEFPEDFVGLDELLKSQTEQIKVDIGSVTLRELVKREHPDITSEEEVDKIVKEALEIIKKKAVAQVKPGVKPPETSDKKSQQQSL